MLKHCKRRATPTMGKSAPPSGKAHLWPASASLLLEIPEGIPSSSLLESVSNLGLHKSRYVGITTLEAVGR